MSTGSTSDDINELLILSVIMLFNCVEKIFLKMHTEYELNDMMSRIYFNEKDVKWVSSLKQNWK